MSDVNPEEEVSTIPVIGDIHLRRLIAHVLAQRLSDGLKYQTDDLAEEAGKVLLPNLRPPTNYIEDQSNNHGKNY